MRGRQAREPRSPGTGWHCAKVGRSVTFLLLPVVTACVFMFSKMKKIHVCGSSTSGTTSHGGPSLTTLDVRMTSRFELLYLARVSRRLAPLVDVFSRRYWKDSIKLNRRFPLALTSCFTVLLYRTGKCSSVGLPCYLFHISSSHPLPFSFVLNRQCYELRRFCTLIEGIKIV